MVPDHKKNGMWVSTVVRKGEQAFTRMGSVYYSMRQRCIPAQRKGNAVLRYEGVKLHRDWATFQPFAIWYSQQPGSNLKYELDKDLLLPGNRVYGPERCCLIPRKLNAAIKIPTNTLRLPGARKIKGQWQAYGYVDGTPKHLGRVESEAEAHSLWTVHKEAHIKSLAEEYKQTISQAAYDALMKWTVKAYS